MARKNAELAESAGRFRRMISMEIQVANQTATATSYYAHVMQRLDRHDARLERIERHLDLVEIPADPASTLKRGARRAGK